MTGRARRQQRKRMRRWVYARFAPPFWLLIPSERKEPDRRVSTLRLRGPRSMR